MIQHKIFSLNKFLWMILLISNIFFAQWISQNTGSVFGWRVVDLSSNLEFNSTAILAVLQFVLFALTVDMTLRLVVTVLNERFQKTQIPAIAVIATSFLVYATIGLLGFILLYDHSLSHILATAGALGLGAAYAFREWIADVTASIQIQTDRLVSINDYIEVMGEKDLYRITQIDHRLITIEDKYHYLLRIPTREFLNWKYINISKQPTKRGIRRRCSFELSTQNDFSRVLNMMQAAMHYLAAKDERIYGNPASHIQRIENGMIGYGVTYECDPTLSYYASTNLVLSALLYIFSTSGINLNSDIELIPGGEAVVDVQKRLLDIYQLSILKVLPFQEIESLAKSVRPVDFEEGEHIIKFGDQAQSMFFILEGRLEIRVPGSDGHELAVATVWPGECVGEMSLLTGEPRSANVYAKSSGILLEIAKSDLEPILQKFPKLIDKLSQILSERQDINVQALTSEYTIKDGNNRAQALAQRIFTFFFGDN